MRVVVMVVVAPGRVSWAHRSCGGSATVCVMSAEESQIVGNSVIHARGG